MATTTETLPMDHPIYRESSPSAVRQLIREGQWDTYTRGLAIGYMQASLVVLPKDDAFDFLLFCQRNPGPCPLVEVLDVGSAVPVYSASGADVRTDLPRYRVFRKGEQVDEPTSIVDYWRDDLVAFLMGCSFTVEGALLDAGVPVRPLEMAVGTCNYLTSIPCRPAGKFAGQMVVSMRPMTMSQAVRATEITARFPSAHGAPVHIGDPQAIGIHDIGKPDFGSQLIIKEDEVPVFWACGVTPQVIALESRLEFMITQKPSHMFITDRREAEVAAL